MKHFKTMVNHLLSRYLWQVKQLSVIVKLRTVEIKIDTQYDCIGSIFSIIYCNLYLKLKFSRSLSPSPQTQTSQ